MWLLTPTGFFSIVRKPQDAAAGTLTVRSRVRADLDGLRDTLLPELGPTIDNAGTDYRYRASARQGRRCAPPLLQTGYPGNGDDLRGLA